MEGVVSLSLPGIFAVNFASSRRAHQGENQDAGRERDTTPPSDRAPADAEGFVSWQLGERVPMPLRRNVRRHAIWFLRGGAAQQVLPRAKRRGGQFRRRGIGTLPHGYVTTRPAFSSLGHERI